MSIRSLADTRGQSVIVQVGTKTVDSVGTNVYTYSTAKTVQAYVADHGAAWEQDNDRPASPRRVTVYIPGNDAIDGQDRMSIDSVVYQVNDVKHPGMKTRGAMAYTIVEGISDPGFSVH